MQFDPIAKELVLVGGGHSHVILLRMLGMAPIPGLQVTLISPDSSTPYSGMLPGVVAGHYSPDDIHIDLVPLCRFAGARFIQGRVEDFDPYSRRVNIKGRPDITYDVLSLNLGITPDVNPLVRDHVIAVKPIGDFLKRWDAFVERTRSAGVNQVGVVGGGAGGVELALAMRQRLHSLAIDPPQIHLLTADNTVLNTYPEKLQARFHRQLREHGITVHLNCRVTRADSEGVENDAGERIALDEIFWVTNAASQSWLSKTGIDLDESGFIQLKPTLQSTNFPDIFAAGDIANVVEHRRPKAGVFAVRQGPILYENIKRFLLDKRPKPYKPQADFLSIVSTGNKYAIATKYGVSVEGRWVWHWKNAIDQRFMNRFRHLPDMSKPRLTGLQSGFDDQMRCGGCGSKVSAQILSEVLRESGVGHQQLDDAAVYEPPAEMLMLHSVDAFKAFLADPYEFAQIAVEHALSDIYAMGGTPKTALALMTIPYATASKTRNMLEQLIAGTQVALSAAGVQLVGGHTTEGAELSLGFAVNGVVAKQSLMSKQGLQVGDQLVLTKPLGSGVIFAADMQYKARGQWVSAALAHMKQSNRTASEVFLKYGVRACTDVTGFGLAGHLLEMLRASKASAVLSMNTIPTMAGALPLLRQGIRSTLHESNKVACPEAQAFGHQAIELLFDPQTAGGLVAAVPKDKAEAVIEALKVAGYESAAVIGYVVERGKLAGGDVRLGFEN